MKNWPRAREGGVVEAPRRRGAGSGKGALVPGQSKEASLNARNDSGPESGFEGDFSKQNSPIIK